jgi:type I restriction enzyme, S subunit
MVFDQYLLKDLPVSIIDGDRGKAYPNRSEFTSSGHCLFLNAGNVTPTGFDFSECSFISEERHLLLRKGTLERGDSVLTTRGTVGNASFFGSGIPYQTIRINSGMVIFRCDKQVLNPLFFYLLLRSSHFARQVESLTTGSAQPQLPIRDIKEISVSVPGMTDQKAIAKVIGTLDEKIELNRKTNETLEGIAKALFKSWFVDFDPVRAKAEGRQTALPDEVSELFPDSFEESELGEIPSGWSVDSFTSQFNVLGGGTPKTSVDEFWSGDLPWFSVVDAPSDSDCWVVDTQKTITHLGLDNCSSDLFRKGTTIISARGTVGKVCLVGAPMAMNQSCYALQPKEEQQDIFCYYSTKEIVEMLKARSHGSVFSTITRDTLHGIDVCCPQKEVVNAFEELSRPMLEKIKLHVDESRTLGSVRDALLPRLISGELRVPDAEKILEEASV